MSSRPPTHNCEAKHFLNFDLQSYYHWIYVQFFLMHISIAKFTKVIFINFIILFLFILCVEILCTLFFDSPVRFIYPLSKTTRDIQTDFDVIYNVDWKTGNRIIDCNNRNNSKNRKVIFVGDSFVFGQGLHVENTFVYLYACKTGDQVKNLGVIGGGLEEYRAIIINQDLANVKLVYLIFIIYYSIIYIVF